MTAQPPHEQYAPFLLKVQTPGQYVGGEWNSTVKADADCRVALAFPDAYAVGMSYHGFRIFYELFNALDGIAAERVFCPFPDMEAQLRARSEVLRTLETGTPLSACTVLAFTLQYEMCLTNILTMLDLGGVPLHAADRTTAHPLVVAGGAGSYNPEPFADFVDLFLVGEGEEAMPEMLAILRECRRAGMSRPDTIRAIVTGSAGWYAPALYRLEDHGGWAVPVPADAAAPERITRRFIADFGTAFQPVKPVVPVVETVHERIVLEIMRGCPNGCRFCQAGMITRPRRHRSVDALLDAARATYAATGYDEIGLLSLSTSDYPCFAELIERFDTEFAPKGVSLSLPSLRVDTQLRDIPERITSVRKGGMTIAPEAGTDRLRTVINKWVTNEDLLSGAQAAYEAGWRTIKLYFMIGLPTETDEDVRAIADLSREVAFRRKKKADGQAVTLSVSNFVPKPQTPFQWYGMDTLQALADKQALLRGAVDRRRVSYKAHELERSLLEAVFARGDRRMGAIALDAWRRGARLDAWDEHFRMEPWAAAFAAANRTMEEVACKTFPDDAQLPWSHIDGGAAPAFLAAERDRARRGEKTAPCAPGQCAGCGVPGCRIAIG